MGQGARSPVVPPEVPAHSRCRPGGCRAEALAQDGGRLGASSGTQAMVAGGCRPWFGVMLGGTPCPMGQGFLQGAARVCSCLGPASLSGSTVAQAAESALRAAPQDRPPCSAQAANDATQGQLPSKPEVPCWGSRQIPSHGSLYVPPTPRSWEGALPGPERLTPALQVQEGDQTQGLWARPGREETKELPSSVFQVCCPAPRR